MTARRNHPAAAAFTLLELIMVLVVIGTALAVAAPSLGGWRRGQKLNTAGDEFLAIVRHARALATANSQVHRLYVDSANGRYWIMAQEGTEFVNLGTGMGRVFEVPEGCQLRMTVSGAPAALEFVDFYPTGRMHPAASVVITGENGDTYAFDTPSAVEGLVVIETARGEAVPR